MIADKIIDIISDFPEFNCVGYFQNHDESMDVILRDMPNLIFINIDMTINGNTPFGLVNELKQYLKNDTELIAISTSKEKSYEAIKMGFFDYLISPIIDLDIRKAIIKFKKKHPTKVRKTICLKSYNDYQYLNVDEILFLRADSNTTDFHMDDGSVINGFKTLRTFESILPENFLRIHRSYIINCNWVSKVSYGNSKCTIKKPHHHIPFSKSYLSNVQQMIKSLSPVSEVGLN